MNNELIDIGEREITLGLMRAWLLANEQLIGNKRLGRKNGYYHYCLDSIPTLAWKMRDIKSQLGN